MTPDQPNRTGFSLPFTKDQIFNWLVIFFLVIVASVGSRSPVVTKFVGGDDKVAAGVHLDADRDKALVAEIRESQENYDRENRTFHQTLSDADGRQMEELGRTVKAVESIVDTVRDIQATQVRIQVITGSVQGSVDQLATKVKDIGDRQWRRSGNGRPE